MPAWSSYCKSLASVSIYGLAGHHVCCTEECSAKGISPATHTDDLDSAQQKRLWGPMTPAVAVAQPSAPDRQALQSSGELVCRACSPPQGYAASCTNLTTADKQRDMI